MNLKAAIDRLKELREHNNLEPLPRAELEAQAKRFLKEKGYLLPEILGDLVTGEILVLKDGVYEIMELVWDEKASEREASNRVIQTIDAEQFKSAQKVGFVESAADLPKEKLFAWSPGDKQEFWCKKIESFVKLTGDLDSLGNYSVKVVGSDNNRIYTVKAWELVPKDDMPRQATELDFLPINSADWVQIKNWLIEKFISSYPWSRRDEKTAKEVKDQMLVLARSKTKGLASMIIQERGRAHFDSKEQFVTRMNDVYLEFPWNSFAEIIDID